MSPTVSDAPSARRRALEGVRDALVGRNRIVLTTHVNADGDGAGSQVAVASWLRRRGIEATILNPTPFPDPYRFLLADLEAYTVADAGGRAAARAADLFLVLDTSERSRIGDLAGLLEDRPTAVIDHHPPNPDALGDPAVRDPTACATGELVWDLLRVDGTAPRRQEAEGLYVAIVTDTGSFRFSNSSSRCHEIAARLLEAGVDPQAMYRRLYAQYTPERLDLLRRALETLRTDPELPIAWISLPRELVEAAGATREDMEGIVEYARRLRGVEVAILLRELPDGQTKVSLRSNGPVDVSAAARSLGGGGHVKASGALLPLSLEAAEEAVLSEVRSAVASVVEEGSSG